MLSTSSFYHYQQDLKVFQEFFDGKSERIKQQLFAEINQCILDQRFERASTLRDVYMHIHQHTQQQTVSLDSCVHGIVAAIYNIESLFILIIIVFQKGKIVDIIRFHYFQEEYDQDQIINSLILEYGDIRIKKSKKQGYGTIYYSSSVTCNKHDWSTIETNLLAYKDSFIASISSHNHPIVEDMLIGLQKRYGFLSYPYYIQCLDISHLSSGWASGAVSSMRGLIADKHEYRRYRIPVELGGDDYGSIKYILLKKFGKQTVRSVSLAPDLFIIDGGLSHLKILQQLFEEKLLDGILLKNTQFVSLGKGDARQSGKKIHGAKEKLFVLCYNNVSDTFFSIKEYELIYDTIDKTLLTIRDEAHRYANAYRKKQYSMEYKQL